MRPAALVLVLLAGSLGCASSSSELQSVPVISDPSGATATAGTQRITTPGSLIVPVGAREVEIRIELAGYEPATVLLTHPDSSAFADCFRRAASEPESRPKPGSIQGPQSPIALGIAAVRAAANCSTGTNLLTPGFVFVKLEAVSAELPPLPSGRLIALR